MKAYIGRSSACKVAVPSLYKKVSRQHAILEMEKGQYFIQDLGGRNGTMLNGNRLIPHQRYTIQPADKILLGGEYVVDWPTVLSALSGKPMPEPPVVPVHDQSGKITTLAGFWRRFVASILDGIIVGIFAVLIFFVFGFSAFTDLLNHYNAAGSISRLILAGILAFAVQWLYFALFESGGWQATLGKKAMGLKVTDMRSQRISFGRATGRFFAKILSGLSFLIGYLMAGFTAKKQALHDVIAETLVYKEMETISR